MTLEQVAHKIGSHKGYVSGIENGKVNPPSVKFIRKFARIFAYDEKNMVRLATVDKAPALVRDEFRSLLTSGAPAFAPAAPSEGLTIPLLNTLDTGYAADLLGEGRPKALTASKLTLPHPKLDIHYAATVLDNAMESANGHSLSKGDFVLLGPAKKLAAGGTYYLIFRQKGVRRALIRLVQIESDERVTLHPLNKEFPVETVTQDDIDAYFRVVGRVALFENSAVGSAL
ncbi:MAG: helix-turn-helix domain-containing protein [Planctomycetes bacterium]|nr:helix-turn-helix domain-containing protein [Planctomycetota bacterium]